MKKNKNLMSQFSVIGAGTLITMILGILNTPIITRIVSTSDYGEYSLFQTYGNLAVSFLYLGMDQALVRYFYVKESDRYRSTLLCKSIILPIISIGIASILFILLNRLEIINTNPIFLPWLIIYVFITTIKRFSDLVVRLQFHSKLYSVNNIVNKIVYLLLALLFLWSSPMDDTLSLVIATIVSSVITIFIGIYSERNIWNWKSNFQVNNSIDTKKLLSYSIPFIFSMGVTSLFQANDKLFVNHFTSSDELGVFSSATSIVALISIFQTTFNTVWAPAAIEHYSKFPEDKEYHRTGNRMITVIMFSVGLTIILFKDLFSLFLGSDYRAAAFILPGLIFGPIMYTISETTVSGIVFKEKSRMHVFIAGGTLLLDIIANSILVPRFGAIGAGLSTGVAYIFFFTLRTIISNHFYYINFSLAKFYILTFISFAFAVYNSFNQFNLIILVWYFICILLLIIFYLDTIKEILQIVSTFIRTKVLK